MTVVPLLAILLAAAAAAPSAPSELAETVTVRLLVVDVLVLDRDDRTVPGLAATDFKLRVDGKTVAIDTFDAECSAAGAEPRASAADGPVTIAPSESGAPRRLALVFDETNLHDRRKWSGGLPRGAAYAEARRLLESALPGDVEIAVAAIGDGARLEQEFTADRRAVLSALAKLESDLTVATRWWGRSPETARARLSVLSRLAVDTGGREITVDVSANGTRALHPAGYRLGAAPPGREPNAP